MKLIYKGKYNGDVNTLPHGEHKPGAVKFKEFDDAKTLGIVANVIALVITVGLFFFICCESRSQEFQPVRVCSFFAVSFPS